jgi:hypothetical protein
MMDTLLVDLSSLQTNRINGRYLEDFNVSL